MTAVREWQTIPEKRTEYLAVVNPEDGKIGAVSVTPGGTLGMFNVEWMPDAFRPGHRGAWVPNATSDLEAAKAMAEVFVEHIEAGDLQGLFDYVVTH